MKENDKRYENFLLSLYSLILPLLLLVLFITFIVIAFLPGSKIGIFFIFPFVYIKGGSLTSIFVIIFFLIIIIIIVISFFYVIFLNIRNDKTLLIKEGKGNEVEKKFGGVILIGPLPIIISSDNGYLTPLILISVFLIIFILLLHLLLG